MWLKGLLIDLLAEKSKEACQRCGSKFRVQLRQMKPFKEIMNTFYHLTAGLMFDEDRWVKFYEREQQFSNLCMECNYLTNQQKMRHFEPSRRKHDLQKLARAVIMATG